MVFCASNMDGWNVTENFRGKMERGGDYLDTYKYLERKERMVGHLQNT